MSSDPRVHKPRLPKAYTDQQLAFLKGNLPEFERRSQGSIRGDAKKFALEKAQDFIQRFGLPDEFLGIEEPDSRFKEQIYNWFKNTVGRTRRKLEGRPRSAKKAAERAAVAAASASNSELNQWNTAAAAAAAHAAHATSSNSMATTSVVSYHTQDVTGSPTVAHPSISVSTTNGAPQQTAQSNATLLSPIQYTNLQQSASSSIGTALNTPVASHAQPPPPPPPPPQQQTSVQQQHAALGTMVQSMSVITQTMLRDAFSQCVDVSTLSNMIQTFVASNPGPTPLAPVVEALFEAISGDHAGSSGPSSSSTTREPMPYVELFRDTSSYFPSSVIHAGVSGPMAGPRALQMSIRKNSVWLPSSHFLGVNVTNTAANTAASPVYHHTHLGHHGHPHMSPHTHSVMAGSSRATSVHSGMTSTLSLSDEMQRIALDRQRRKDHIIWARIHAAALELDMLGPGRLEMDPTNGLGNQQQQQQQHHAHSHNLTHGHTGHNVSHQHQHSHTHPHGHHNHDMNAMSGISSMSSMSPMAGGTPNAMNGMSPATAAATVPTSVSMVDSGGYSYAMGRAFSEMMARDAVWEADEVEWAAGICVLRALIRTHVLGDRRQIDEYDELLRAYEGRWKEIKDEARQLLVAEILLSAKDELSRLDNTLS